MGVIDWVLNKFISPWYEKPIIEIKYLPEKPFVIISNDLIFHRFSVENIGKSKAENCLCEILDIERNGSQYGNFHGLPLKWAAQNLSGNKLTISIGETKHVDLVMGVKKKSELHFLTNTNSETAVDKAIMECGVYTIKLKITGDNFEPQNVLFTINLTNNFASDKHIDIQYHKLSALKDFKNKQL